MLRGNNRRRLFSYTDDYRLFLRLFERACPPFGCRVHALCLMVNHVHDLTTPPSVESMSGFVKNVSQRYAQIRNTKRDASGKLFEQRYKSKPVADEHHLAAATAYIDANPLRAGRVKDALDYPWSTYAIHVGQPNRSAIPRSLWTPSPWYLSLGSSAAKRADVYRQFFEAYVAKDDFSAFDDFEIDEMPYRRRLLRPNGSRAAESTIAARSPTISEK
jgi:putative transposase